MGLIIHVRGLTITSIVTIVQNNIHSPLLSSYYNKYFCTNIIQKYFMCFIHLIIEYVYFCFIRQMKVLL